jgi:hypothetical protein
MIRNIDKWIRIFAIGLIICNLLFFSTGTYIKSEKLATGNNAIKELDPQVYDCLLNISSFPLLFVDGLIITLLPFRVIGLINRELKTKISLGDGYMLFIQGLMLLFIAVLVWNSTTNQKCIEYVFSLTNFFR